MRTLLVFGFTLLICMAPVLRGSEAAEFQPNSTVDSIDANPGDGICSDPNGLCTLRAAVMESNALPGADTILLPPNVYELSIDDPAEDAAEAGDLDVHDDLIIDGLGDDQNTIIRMASYANGYSEDGILEIFENARVTISDLAITNGRGDFSERPGGAIKNRGELTISSVRMQDNGGKSGWGYPGAIGNVGQLHIKGSSFIDNEGTDGGNPGAILSGGTMDITGTYFEGNFGEDGGAIKGGGVILIVDSVFRNQRAEYGGAIYNTGSTTIVGSQFIGNRASLGYGGAILYGRGGSLLIVNSELRDNCAEWAGGAIYNLGNTKIIGSTLSGNGACYSEYFDECGGAFRGGRLELLNSTVTGNSTGDSDEGGGAICAGEVAVTNSTITGNSTQGNGGGLEVSKLTISGSIIAGNTAALSGPDCSVSATAVTSLGYNIIGDASGCPGFDHPTDLVGSGLAPVDPLLGPLQNNGGPTKTHAPGPGSPALNAIPAANCVYDHDSDPNTPGAFLRGDQRGIRRPSGSGCEIGAYEVGSEFVGDLDGDGDLDSDDATLFQAAYGAAVGGSEYDLNADLDGDGQVTLVDYQQFLLALGNFTPAPTLAPLIQNATPIPLLPSLLRLLFLTLSVLLLARQIRSGRSAS